MTRHDDEEREMTDEEREMPTDPEDIITRRDNPMPHDPLLAERVIGNLLDEKLGTFLKAQAKRDEELMQLVRDAIDRAMVNHEVLRQAEHQAREANRVANDAKRESAKALQLAEENKRRLDSWDGDGK